MQMDKIQAASNRYNNRRQYNSKCFASKEEDKPFQRSLFGSEDATGHCSPPSGHAEAFVFFTNLFRPKQKKVTQSIYINFSIHYLKLDYAVPVFYHSLPKYLTHELERIQKRVLAIMCPDLNYNEALTRMDLVSINEHHSNLCNNFFNDILNDKSHRLYLKNIYIIFTSLTDDNPATDEPRSKSFKEMIDAIHKSKINSGDSDDDFDEAFINH